MRIIVCALGAALLTACNPSADTDNPAIATEEAASERMADAPSAGANSFTEDQARSRFTDAGYANVTNLTQGPDGSWRAQATQGGQAVTVMLDYQGNVVPSEAGAAGATGAGSSSGTAGQTGSSGQTSGSTGQTGSTNP